MTDRKLREINARREKIKFNFDQIHRHTLAIAIAAVEHNNEVTNIRPQISFYQIVFELTANRHTKHERNMNEIGWMCHPAKQLIERTERNGMSFIQNWTQHHVCAFMRRFLFCI